MGKNEGLITIVVVAIVFALTVAPVKAQEGPVSYGGIEFPLGNKSFADKLMDFNPGSGTGEKDGSAVVGPPDGGKATGPSVIGAKGDVTLGKGGSITLKFTDNYLIDVEGLDLYVFEYGQDVEPFKVEISKDGSGWIDLGTVRGQPTGLDIQGKVAPGDRFSYVRITDANPYAPRDPKTIGTKAYAGADIDAVGAIGAEEKHDSDGDGILDDDDNCSDTSAGTEVDEYGCPVTTTVGADSDAGAVVGPKTTSGSSDFSGKWSTTNFGGMTLIQNGNSVSGSYSHDNGKISGTVTGNILKGTWSEAPSYSPSDDAGDMEFTLAQDGNSWTGRWRYGSSGDWYPDWTGTRIGGTTPSPVTTTVGADSDGDGIPDDDDTCPNTSAGTEVDEYGCPVTTTALAGVCASAKPSITSGSVFKQAEFTIGGTEPQTIKITSSAENFAINKESGGSVYQMIDGKSWGNLILEPGSYILSCNGGGAMGLMSASVCLAYTTDGTVPPGTPPTPPSGPGRDDKPPRIDTKPSLPVGPVERVFIHPVDDLTATQLHMKLGKKKRFAAWGEDAAGNKAKNVTVRQWDVRNPAFGKISKEGLFTAGPQEGRQKILATVRNEEGDDVTGAFPIDVSALAPITFEGRLRVYDHNGKQLYPGGVDVELSAKSYKTRADWDNGGFHDDRAYVKEFMFKTKTNPSGKFKYVVPSEVNDCFLASWYWEIDPPYTAPRGYDWVPIRRPDDQPDSNEAVYNDPVDPGENGRRIYIAPQGFKCFQWWLEEVPLTFLPFSIEGKVTHHGKPVNKAKVELLHQGKAVGSNLSDVDGDYLIHVSKQGKGSYRLTAKYQPPPPPIKDQPPPPEKIATVHTWLYINKDIWVEFPLPTIEKTIDIKLISWAEKIGYTGP